MKWFESRIPNIERSPASYSERVSDMAKFWDDMAGPRGISRGIINYFSRIGRGVVMLEGEKPEEWPINKLHIAFANKTVPLELEGGPIADTVFLKSKKRAGQELVLYDEHTYVSRIALLGAGVDGQKAWDYLEFDSAYPIIQHASSRHEGLVAPTRSTLEAFHSALSDVTCSRELVPTEVVLK